MAQHTKTANDKNGVALYIGDEVICRAIVTEISDDHVLTNSVEPPNKEIWFQGQLVERTAQGAASLGADHRVGVGGAAPAAPTPIADPSQGGQVGTAVAEPAELTKLEQAIAFVMSHGRDRQAAEKIVNEHGWRYILADRDEEEEAKKASTSSGTNGAAAADANQAATNEQAKPGSPA